MVAKNQLQQQRLTFNLGTRHWMHARAAGLHPILGMLARALCVRYGRTYRADTMYGTDDEGGSLKLGNRLEV